MFFLELIFLHIGVYTFITNPWYSLLECLSLQYTDQALPPLVKEAPKLRLCLEAWPCCWTVSFLDVGFTPQGRYRKFMPFES